jgi:hypothetical protein
MRRGVTFAFVAVTIIVLLGMASLTVDVGMMYRARAEAQSSADAAALAGASQLFDHDRLAGSPMMTDEIAAARAAASQYAAANAIVNASPDVDASGDVLVGRLDTPWDPNEPMSYADPSRFNTVRTLVRRDAELNGPIDLFFAGIFGQTSKDVQAEAFAIMRSDIAGFDPSVEAGNSSVLPLALSINAWNNLLNGTFTSGDDYTHNADSETVSNGADGINELNLYPGGGVGQLPAGNFGTLDIGGADNSSDDIKRQILDGLSPQDITDLGKDFVLGSDGTLPLNGDTGISAGFEAELKAIIGKPRIIPLFSTVTGPGNNSTFTIVGFAGIVILDVKLTGAMSKKRVTIQPAFVIDDTAIPGDPGFTPGVGDFVYRPVELVR